MERSLFTIAVEHDTGEHILFNTLRGSLAVCDAEAYGDYLERAGMYADVFAQAGFVVADAQAEIDFMRDQFNKDKDNRDVLSLCLAPTYRCNLACSFCYEREQDIPGHMSQEVLEGIVAFVERVYRRNAFERLFITWYGGEPVLCLDVIEKLSDRLVGFCAKNEIGYAAEIISNATLVDAAVADRLAACRVTHALPTFAGCRDLHNCRRTDKAGGDSFEMTKKGIENLRAAGIVSGIAVNVDKRSIDDYRSLRSWVREREGLSIFPAMIRDYLGNFDKGQLEEGEYNLFSREEFSRVAYRLHEEDGFTADTLRGLLSPIRNFCRGQLENYFVIDSQGDVYKCDGWMGYGEHALGSVLEGAAMSGSVTAPYNPMDDTLCRMCSVLPLCKGQCAWDRALFEEGCHPFKYTIGEYVKAYRDCFGSSRGSVTVFVEPFDLEEFFAQPFTGDGLTLATYPDS